MSDHLQDLKAFLRLFRRNTGSLDWATNWLKAIADLERVVEERFQTLLRVQKLTQEISDALHPVGDGPRAPSLHYILSYVRGDKRQEELRKKDEEAHPVFQQVYPLLGQNRWRWIYESGRQRGKGAWVKQTTREWAAAIILKRLVEQIEQYGAEYEFRADRLREAYEEARTFVKPYGGDK